MLRVLNELLSSAISPLLLLRQLEYDWAKKNCKIYSYLYISLTAVLFKDKLHHSWHIKNNVMTKSSSLHEFYCHIEFSKHLVLDVGFC